MTTANENSIDTSVPRDEMVQRAIANPHTFDELVEALSGENRRSRQYAAGIILALAQESPELLVPCIDQFSDALHRPEAQTRWQMLETLSILAAYDTDACDDAFAGAQTSLYDEDSDFVRLSAVRFLCAYGAHDEKRSQQVWPFLDEAIQCYHGDPEFQDMLIALIGFSQGKLADSVKKALVERVKFDADNGRGPLARRTAQIIANCS